jgi:ribonuclease BN (tRNA processing enzyme)
MGVRITALGTGVCANGYFPNTVRKPPGFLIDVDGTLILFDCSEGIRYRIQEAGYEYGLVQHVAVSHAHPDHVALPQFLQARSCRRLWGEDQPEFGLCTVYLPKDLVKGFQQVWNWHLPENDGKYWPEFTPKFVPLDEGSSIGITPEVTLKSYPVYHGFGRHPSVALRLETPYGVIAYSGDSSVCDGLIQAAMHADLFICEQSFQIGFKDKDKYGHLTPKDVAHVCLKTHPKAVRLTHYTGLDTPRAVLREIKNAGFQGDVKHAKDGDVWKLK